MLLWVSQSCACSAEQVEHPEGFKQKLQLLEGDHPAAQVRSTSHLTASEGGSEGTDR